MTEAVQATEPESKTKRADARRNEQALLDAAAAVFVTSGVDAPVREIAAKAGVGVGTIYRHFPTRPELVVAVYRHQVETCAEAGPTLLAEAPSAELALYQWIAMFVDFLVTKHGLASALQNDSAESDALHAYFVDRLIPVCSMLLDAATENNKRKPPVSAYGLMRGIGNLCIGAGNDPRYDARKLVHALVSGVLAGSH